jgi:hypothetical protein
LSNRHEIHGDEAWLFVEKKDGWVFKVVFDAEDLDLVRSFGTWNTHSKELYALIRRRRSGKQTAIYLHRVVSNAGLGTVVDHINGDRLDNRKVNLRVVTKRENAFNLNRFAGVSWVRRDAKWLAQLSMTNNHMRIGCYDSFEEAGRALIRTLASIDPISALRREQHLNDLLAQ